MILWERPSLSGASARWPLLTMDDPTPITAEGKGRLTYPRHFCGQDGTNLIFAEGVGAIRRSGSRDTAETLPEKLEFVRRVTVSGLR
jgi:hypothetical protein